MANRAQHLRLLSLLVAGPAPPPRCSAPPSYLVARGTRRRRAAEPPARGSGAWSGWVYKAVLGVAIVGAAFGGDASAAAPSTCSCPWRRQRALALGADPRAGLGELGADRRQPQPASRRRSASAGTSGTIDAFVRDAAASATASTYFNGSRQPSELGWPRSAVRRRSPRRPRRVLDVFVRKGSTTTCSTCTTTARTLTGRRSTTRRSRPPRPRSPTSPGAFLAVRAHRRRAAFVRHGTAATPATPSYGGFRVSTGPVKALQAGPPPPAPLPPPVTLTPSLTYTYKAAERSTRLRTPDGQERWPSARP